MAQDDAEAGSISVLCTLILCVLVVALGAFLWVFGASVSRWLNSPALDAFWWLLPIGVFGVGAIQIGRLLAIRMKEFKRLAAAGMASSICIVATQVVLGLLQFGPAGLIFGRAGGLLGSGTVMLPIMRKNARLLMPEVTRLGVVKAAKRHYQFPLYFLPSSLLNSFGREMPIIFLSMFFGPAITGLYALTRRTLHLPMILIGEQVRRVYYSYAVDESRDGDLPLLTKSIFTILTQIGLPGIAIFFVVAPELFGLVFGERWSDSGIYAQWLSPWLFMTFICAPMTRLPQIMEKQGKELCFQIILLSARALALIVGGLVENLTLTFGLFGGVSFLCWVGYLIWTMSLLDIGPVEILGLIAREAIVSALIVSPLILFKFVILIPDQDLWALAVSGGCVMLGAFVVMLRNRHIVLPGYLRP